MNLPFKDVKQCVSFLTTTLVYMLNNNKRSCLTFESPEWLSTLLSLRKYHILKYNNCYQYHHPKVTVASQLFCLYIDISVAQIIWQ